MASRPELGEVDHAAGAEEVVRRQAAGEAGRGAGGQHVRRAGGVVAQRHGRVLAHEHGAGVANLRREPFGSRRTPGAGARWPARWPARPPRPRRAPGSGRRTLRATAGPARRARASPVASPAPPCTASISRSRPGDEDRRARGVLGLGDQVGGDEVGPARAVGDDDHLAGPGDRVDADVAEDVLLGQRDEQIAGADDLVDARAGPRRRTPAPPPPAPRRCDRPRVTPSSWHVASKSWLYEPNGVGGATTAISLDARRLRGDDRHQHRRGIRRRAAGHAHADAPQRQVALRRDSRRARSGPSRRGAGSPAGTAGCASRIRRTVSRNSGSAAACAAASSAGGTRSSAAVSCLAVELGRVLEHRRRARACARRGKSARRPAPASAARQTPRSSSCGPASLTTSPSGASLRPQRGDLLRERCGSAVLMRGMLSMAAEWTG